jgi:hypothetical protein
VTAPALATLALVALNAAMGSLKISDAARAYARRSLVDPSAIMNLEDQLRIDAELRWPKVQVELGYGPRLTFVDVLGPGPSPTLWLHSGAARVSLREPRYTLSLTQTGTVGEQDFAQAGAIASPAPARQAEATTPTPNQPSTQPMVAQSMATQPMATGSTSPALNLLPNARAVGVAAEETAANLNMLWTRRWSSDLKASFGFSGGSNDVDRMLLPRQRRAQLDGSLGFDWSRRDRVSTVLTGAQIVTSNGYEHWLTSASETWAARWAARSDSQFGLGVAFQDTTAPGGMRITHWSPIGSANLTHAMLLHDVQVRLQAGLGYAPEVNVLLGRLQNRLQATSLVTVATTRTAVSLILGAAQTIPTGAPDAATLASAALTFDHEIVRWLSAEMGGQVARQALGGAIGSARPTWLLYAGLVARAPEQRF